MREGKDLYVAFPSPDVASGISDQTFTNSSGTTVKVESLDRKRVRFRIHWFPFHTKGELVEDYMDLYGENVEISYDTQTYDAITVKIGTMTGSMTCTEKQYKSTLPRQYQRQGGPHYCNGKANCLSKMR